MDSLFWWTGFLVWTCVGLMAAWLVGEIVFAFAVTVSWARWVIRCARTHRRPLRWRGFPITFLSHWAHFIGFRKGRISMHGNDGHWEGIGCWSVTAPTPSSTTSKES